MPRVISLCRQKKSPKLRHTAPKLARQVYTVKEGCILYHRDYKSDGKGEFASHIQWHNLEKMIPYGGVRIEDNIVLHADGTLENLTRDAFSQQG